MMVVTMWGVVVALLVGLCGAEEYDGYQVLRIVPSNAQQIKLLEKLNTPTAIERFGFDFWREPTIVGQPVDIMLEGKHVRELAGLLESLGIGSHVMVENVGDLIEAQKMKSPDKNKKKVDHTEYMELHEIEAWMDDIVANHPNLAQLVTVGSSYEGRTIRAIKISSDGAPGKRTMWIDSGIHSREWVSIGMMLYFVEQFLTQYGEDTEITRLVDEMDWYMLPVYNPDGYVYTWDGDRMWRKTRSPNEGSSCVGCDPNRNWDYEWGGVGTSPNPCSQTFPGSAAFSEVEVREVAGYIGEIPNLAGYIAYHSYGQMYMLPYGYTTDEAPDFQELLAACNAAVDDLRAVHGYNYRCNSLINLVGPSSGSSVDYAYGRLNIKYSFGVELRDTGLFGFLLPPAQIIPTAEENFAALLSLANYVVDNPQ